MALINSFGDPPKVYRQKLNEFDDLLRLAKKRGDTSSYDQLIKKRQEYVRTLNQGRQNIIDQRNNNERDHYRRLTAELLNDPDHKMGVGVWARKYDEAQRLARTYQDREMQDKLLKAYNLPREKSNKAAIKRKDDKYRESLSKHGISLPDESVDAISGAAYEPHTQQQVAAKTAAAQTSVQQTPAALTEQERYQPVVGDQEEPQTKPPSVEPDKPKAVDPVEPKKETPDPGGVTWEQVIGATSLFNIAANIPALMQKRQEVGMLPTPKLQYITWNRDSKEHLANVDRQVDRGQRGAMDYMRKIGGQSLYSPADGDASVMQYTAEAARQDQAQMNAINAANIGIANQEVAMLEAEKNAAREYQYKTDALLAQGRQNAMGNISNSIFDYYQSLISLRDRVGGLNKWYSRNKPTPEETVDAIEKALPEGEIVSNKMIGLPKKYNPPLVPPMNSNVDLTGSYGAAEDMKRRIPMGLLGAEISQQKRKQSDQFEQMVNDYFSNSLFRPEPITIP